MAARRERTVTVTVAGPLARDDLPELFERTCALLAGTQAELLLCEVAGVQADAVAVEALARLALAARRNSCAVRLHGASVQLRGLVCLCGLDDVLIAAEGQPPAAPGLPVPPADSD